MQKFEFKAKVWLYSGQAAWHFASLPKGLSADLKKWFGEEARGWGSLPVEVELGKSKWKTSIFPDSKTKTYLLPLKAAVRKIENVTASSTYSFSIQILV